MKSFRNPRTWRVTEAPEQIELGAVAVGSPATAEEGGSLLSRVLLNQLKRSGWPADLRTFQSVLETAIKEETEDATKLPRLRILSPRFEYGISLGDNAEECRQLLGMLGKCEIPFESYQPFYLRTMGALTSDPQVLSASTLTAMIRELLEFQREPEFGNRSMALVEFFERVRREFKKRAQPIRGWLSQVPAGGLLSIRNKLDKEASDLVLTIRLKESSSKAPSSRDGYPVTIEAELSDANYLSTILKWSPSRSNNLADLELQVRTILTASDAQARRQKDVSLRVQVFANPSFISVPLHMFAIDPEDQDPSETFGRFHSFVMRSRARLVRAPKYDLASWRQKAKALRQRPCGKIVFEPAPDWRDDSSEELNDQLATVDGLLLILQPLSAPCDANEGLYKMLETALRRGVPLASWPVGVADSWQSHSRRFDSALRELFDNCGSLEETPERFLIKRKSQAWARNVTLFWDDDDTEKYVSLTGKEPNQL